MYAFTDKLRSAWQALFGEFLLINELDNAVEPTIRFETDFDLLRNPNMLLGHTCGYPLMRFLRNDCQPVCVPRFDIVGCNGKYYSSHIVASIDSDIVELRGCHNKIAAINGYDSNSGMNVLRHAVSLLGHPPPFFSKVIESGSHFKSLSAVVDGKADVAAIDSVSFALIKDEWPELIKQVKTIGSSKATCGLPLVISYYNPMNIEQNSITRSLNFALTKISEDHKKILHLTGFENVTLADYQSIIDLETKAFEAGYTKLE